MSRVPSVSILMPVRNEERYLQAALDSLYRQTLDDWELVAVDDGSSDSTPRILASAAASDSRIKMIRRDGGGLVAALNTGLELCCAPLLARMDGDDISHPRRLAEQVAYLGAHPDTGLVACSFKHFPRTSLKQGMVDYETWQNSLQNHTLISKDLFVESPFVHPGVMCRRSILEQLGGYRDHGWAEDYDLWLRMAAANVHFARLPGR
ncbi:MAG TPA: glycosyl transferase, partial [Geobacter sp.]|nr:glycosyl transferase [Geobacter sp.]